MTGPMTLLITRYKHDLIRKHERRENTEAGLNIASSEAQTYALGPPRSTTDYVWMPRLAHFSCSFYGRIVKRYTGRACRLKSAVAYELWLGMVCCLLPVHYYGRSIDKNASDLLYAWWKYKYTLTTIRQCNTMTSHEVHSGADQKAILKGHSYFPSYYELK